MSKLTRWIVIVGAVLGADLAIGYLLAINSDAYANARAFVLESRLLRERLGPLRSVRIAIPSRFSVHQVPEGDLTTLDIVVSGDRGKERIALTLVGHDDSWRVLKSSPAIDDGGTRHSAIREDPVTATSGRSESNDWFTVPSTN